MMLLPVMLAGSCATSSPQNASDLNDAPQGWDKAHRVAWHTASQGSRLIPRDWLDVLEQPGSTTAFLDKNYIASFRYLPNDSGDLQSPDPACPFDRSLPLGFTVDCQNDKNLSNTKLQWQSNQSNHEPWVGMNCSACHTTELTYKGTTIRVEGGPTLADFQSLTEKLEQALQETATDTAKFDRFAAKVPHADKAMLATALARLNQWNSDLAQLNDPGVLRYGFGRLDAVGHILNKVSLAATPNDIGHQISNPSDAPVSYPFLWNVPQLDKVEWNGIAPRAKVGAFPAGALVRNTTEVIGVFADLTIAPRPGPAGLKGYNSSVQLKTLEQIENQLESLLPPKWPGVFPPINTALVATGKTLFAQQCANCHTVPASPDDLKQAFQVTLQPVLKGNVKGGPTNTDMWMACNALLDQTNSGLFKGNNQTLIAPPPITAVSPSITLATNAAVGVLLANKVTVLETAIPGIFGYNKGLPLPRPLFQAGLTAKQAREAKCRSYQDDPTNPKLVYKGRPLQGIWATAPFLHNGSVPSLWQLLLPPDQRVKTFQTGTREYDPDNVGFEIGGSAAGNTFKFDTAIVGNSNAGHDYGTAITTGGDAKTEENNRRALMEYLKTL
jgi:mono/diheme cytochrome c family protein